jgi:tol-pal system protein YbgF
MSTPRSFKTHALAWVTACVLLPSAQAALFEDDEARRAILDLRQRMERQNEVNQQMQRSLLEQQNQFEAVRAEIARLRGEKEQLSQDLRQQQEAAKSAATAAAAALAAAEERLRKLEPVKVKVDGAEFLAEPAEVKAFDQALAVFRQGDFVNASISFTDVLKRYPGSGYTASSLFWLGNAQYANRDYKEAIRNFSALLSKSPDHPRAPESMLSIANCQLELKDIKSARKTLEEVIKTFPQSDVADAARERLSKLK